MEEAVGEGDAARVESLLGQIDVTVQEVNWNLVVYAPDWALAVDPETFQAIGVMQEVLARGEEELAAVFAKWCKAHSLPLHKLLPTALKHKHEEVALLLLHEMFDDEILALSSTEALHLAVKANMLQATRTLLRMAHLSETFLSVQHGLNPLQDSLSKERDERIALLLIEAWPEEGLLVKDRRGRSLLHRAAAAHLPLAAEQLLTRMPQEAVGRLGCKRDGTALHVAAAEGQEAIAMAIAARMADECLCLANRYAETALHLAAEKGMAGLLGLLLSRMPSPAVALANDRGLTAADLAAAAGLDADRIFSPLVKAAD